MGNVVWNVDGQRRDLRLDRLLRGLRGVPPIFLAAGKCGEGNLDICAGESERAPLKERGGCS